MTTTNLEQQGTQERIAYFERLLGPLQATATPEEFQPRAGGYRAELERMQVEVINHLTRPLESQERVKVAALKSTFLD